MIFVKNKLVFLIIFVLGLALGLGIYHIFFSSRDNLPDKSSIEIRATNYKYINPLLECETFSTSGTKELTPLKSKLNELISQQINSGLVNSVSVYFRDLNNGPWFGINEEEKFSPASLLKLPILISLLKNAETDQNYLNQKINFNMDLPDIPQDYQAPSVSVEKSKEYTVDELLTEMIEHSDNKAMYLLLNGLKLDYLDLTSQLNKELGLNENLDSNGDQPMSVKSYASLFRVLFNASYLSRYMSEKALDILTKVEYKNGLVAGIPSNLVVAHKFGERTLSNNTRQLHDCGIIYYPKHPYLLCIMTRGSVYENLELLIRTISEQVYQSVDLNFAQKP